MTRILAALLFGALVCSGAYAKGRFLPPVAKTEMASKVRQANPWIRGTRERHFAGALPSKSKLRAEGQIVKRAEAFAKQLAASSDRRPIIIVLEGVDGAGKSSFIRRLNPALAGKKVKVIHFGAPEPGEEHLPWRQRYFNKLAPEPDTVYILDRSYHGEAVYPLYHHLVDDAGHRERVAGIAGIERTLRKDFRMVKFFFDASSKRQGATVGKRESIELKRNLLGTLSTLLVSDAPRAQAHQMERVVLGRLQELRSKKATRKLGRKQQARLLGKRLARDVTRLSASDAQPDATAQLATHRALMGEDFRVVDKLVEQLAKAQRRASRPVQHLEPEKLADSDYTTLRNEDSEQIRALFEVAMKQTATVTPWHFINMNKRMKGTADAFDVLEKELLPAR